MVNDDSSLSPVQQFVQGVNSAWIFDGSPGSIMILVLFVLIFIFGWIGLSRYYQKRIRIQDRWTELLNLSYQKGLSPNQIRVLKTFFFGLPFKLSHSLLEDWGAFKKLLAENLNRVTDISNELKVRLMDRLFLPGMDSDHPIEKSADLAIGESIGLEIDSRHYMGSVIEKKEKDLLVCIPNWGPPPGLAGKDSKLYAYRPEIGGYLFTGSILSTKKDCVYFRHSGQFESKVYFHLMVEKALSVKFTSWPQVDESASFAVDPKAVDDVGKSIPILKKNLIVYGHTYKVSDRALSFSFKTDTDFDTYQENEQIVWEMTLLMPDNSTLICRGKIMNLEHQRGISGTFFYKFIDLSDTDREKIFHWIQANHPIKEKMTI